MSEYYDPERDEQAKRKQKPDPSWSDGLTGGENQHQPNPAPDSQSQYPTSYFNSMEYRLAESEAKTAQEEQEIRRSRPANLIDLEMFDGDSQLVFIDSAVNQYRFLAGLKQL